MKYEEIHLNNTLDKLIHNLDYANQTIFQSPESYKPLKVVRLISPDKYFTRFTVKIKYGDQVLLTMGINDINMTDKVWEELDGRVLAYLMYVSIFGETGLLLMSDKYDTEG